MTDPALTLEPSESIAKIWSATCRIVDYPGLQECFGTGFFTHGGAEDVVVVTNAHVVDSRTTVGIEWIEGDEIVSWSASLIAIDYTHDLAILKPALVKPFDEEAPTFPAGLEMGTPPHPGDELWLAGYPHGVQTPRVARALASGYDIYQPYGCAVAAVMLDGNVNPGNSGGPVFDASQMVVGVVAALRRNPLFTANESAAMTDEMRKTIETLSRVLSAASGIGYAIHPIHVRRMLSALESCPDRAREAFEKFAPAESEMRREDFIALQRHGASARGEKMSPIGVFSVDEDGSYYAGWSTNKERIRGEQNDSWKNLSCNIRAVGRNFILRGYDIVAYHPKRDPYPYGYWAVAVRLQISD